MSVKNHYDNHLAHFYSWMVGDFDKKVSDFETFLRKNNVSPQSSKIALDLGAGHGIQSLALSKVGFDVKAIDFNQTLLNELNQNTKNHSVTSYNEDINAVRSFSDPKPELIVCCGDTITHLDNKEDIEKLITNCSISLSNEGKLILSFRDYSTQLNNQQRFIPVKSDDQRILTCILEYGDKKVTVTDLLHEKTEDGWYQQVSSYEKVRVSTDEIIEMIESNGLQITYNESDLGLCTLIAQ